MELIELKFIADVLTGYPFKSNLYGNEGIRAVRGENITEGKLRWDSIKCWNEPFDKKDFYSLKSDDIVIGMDGSKVGKNKARIFEEDLPLLLAQRVACLRTNEKADQVYLYYCINNPRFEEYVFRIQTGSSVPHISKTQIENFQIPIPSLIIQKQIAKVLSDLDAKIEVNNKINQELEALAKSIYDYWFVQFDFPYVTSSGVEKPYKSSGGKMVYNEELKREIPEGWESNTMADWIENDANGDWGKEEPTGNYTVKVNCIRGADLPSLDGFKTNEAPIRFINENKTHKILKSNDLIVEISGGSPTQSTGRISFVTEETFKRYEAPLICANFCKAVRLKEPKNLYNFYYTWKEAFEQGNMFNYEGKTSGIRNLLFSSLIESFKVPIPNTGLVEKFYDFMKPIQKQKQRNLLENQKLAELRDWLLPMLMNGQVTVRSPEEVRDHDKAKEQLGMVAEGNGKYEGK